MIALKESRLTNEKVNLKLGRDFEDQALSEGYRFIAGVDEVGRGCLAGPVVAAACILDPLKPLPQWLDDSKKLTAKRRIEVNAYLIEHAVAFAIARIEPEEIDRINILQATKKAMVAAIGQLSPAADYLLIDALQLKEVDLPQKALIKGDAISASIAAASILAKTFRDDLMADYDKDFPGYGFAKHVGYGTKQHFEAIRSLGACSIHRKSFRGVV